MNAPRLTQNGPPQDFLDLPLDGVRLIEASAGTGKTFTLATLVTRLVIERQLRVGQILAVTYTEAATQELRERLRVRLELAARLANEVALMPTSLADDGDAAITRALIERQAKRENPVALARRLRQAAREMDLAAVFTIHGFCARALAEHAVEAGQPLLAPELIGSERELIDAVATDLWRALGANAVEAELLQAQWRTPEEFAADLGKLLHAPRIEPAAPDAHAPDPLQALRDAAAALRAAFCDHGDDGFAKLGAAIEAKALNGNSYKPGLPAELRRALAQWCAQEDPTAAIHERIERLKPQTLTDKTNKPKKAGVPLPTPTSPLFDAVARYLEAADQREAWLGAQRIALVHRVREQGAQRLAALKRLRREQTFDDLIADLAHALESEHGARLVERLRAQYAFALVDEFQDTDPRQWAIFERVFGDAQQQPALFLIGDPKQAIYRFRGGDVHTYLAAKESAQLAPALDRNFRSRPSLLRVIAALYAQAGDGAFVDARIRFRDVHAGDVVHDQDFRRDGCIAPALTVDVLPAPDSGKPQWQVGEARERAAQACVAAVFALLADARAGRAVLREKERERAPEPGDIAVLVRNHAEATLMRGELVRSGIPAVAAGRSSLFATEQARDVLALLEALLHPDDDARLRGALATMLVGLDSATLVRFDTDPVLHRDWQLRALAWRDRWRRHGPLALLNALCAEQAPRLLALGDGERRLTNALQLAEALQEADTHAVGEHGLVDWLRTQIAEADANDETQQLRLESDARCVQILTLHKSKGLEFPFVFLPFASIGRDSRSGNLCEYHDGTRRVLQLRSEATPVATAAWKQAQAQQEDEERGEDARLLYVGLTRARHMLWLATGPFAKAELSPLARMLDDPEALVAALPNPEAIAVRRIALPLTLPEAWAPAQRDVVSPARNARRQVPRDWWVYSFTQLANEAAGAVEAAPRAVTEEGGAQDEPTPALFEGDARFAGSRFGNVLHGALERVDFAAWTQWPHRALPDAQREHLRAALRAEGYGEADLEDGIHVLEPLIGHTLTVPLPEGARLCAVASDQRAVEMEFHFALRPTAVADLLALLHAHGLLRQRQAFGTRQRLEGLMTGKIDLVYAHAERFYVLDYKSNRLPAYHPEALAAAMDDSEYTLQALLYALALHRWLRFRLGASYAYDTHFGGIRYLFCRGLDATDPAGPGVHAWLPSRALIDGLDALFGYEATEGSA